MRKTNQRGELWENSNHRNMACDPKRKKKTKRVTRALRFLRAIRCPALLENDKATNLIKICLLLLMKNAAATNRRIKNAQSYRHYARREERFGGADRIQRRHFIGVCATESAHERKR